MESNTEIIINAINSAEKNITEKLDNMNNKMSYMSNLLEEILIEIKKFDEKKNNSEQFGLSKSESKERVPEDNNKSKRNSERNNNIRTKLYKKDSKKAYSIKKGIYHFQFRKK